VCVWGGGGGGGGGGGVRNRKTQVKIVNVRSYDNPCSRTRQSMSGDKTVDVAAEIRTGHLPNTSREHYRVERLRNSTKNISLRIHT